MIIDGVDVRGYLSVVFQMFVTLRQVLVICRQFRVGSGLESKVWALLFQPDSADSGSQAYNVCWIKAFF